MDDSNEYFEGLIKSWFTGNKTSPEIISETKGKLNIEKHLNEGYDFDYAYTLALTEYSEKYRNLLDSYFAEETVVCLTVNGVIRNLEMLRNNSISVGQFLEWASWSNIGCENSTLGIENDCIEYLCSIFLLKFESHLESKEFIDSLIAIVRFTNSTPYEKFIFQIFLLIDSERKSIYYFFRDYLNSKKNTEELDLYLIKKFSYNLPRFKYGLDRFPYKQELEELKQKEANVEDFLLLLKFNN